ncbi:MAG: hypothetical protein R2748_10180 [Bryobacterales bacterium]
MTTISDDLFLLGGESKLLLNAGGALLGDAVAFPFRGQRARAALAVELYEGQRQRPRRRVWHQSGGASRPQAGPLRRCKP